MSIWRERSFQHTKEKIGAVSDGPYPRLIADLLASRGLQSKDEIENILNPKLGQLKDPNLLLGMTKAVHRLIDAYKKDQSICIYADFDLDGTSGLAILKLGLENLGYKKISFYQPKRLSEGYGFHAHAVEELKTLGIDLIITVDVGITSHKAFEKAQELSLDVILTDHHLPTEILPSAYCIINPNQKDCQSGLGYLCGAGVAFYLIRALKRAFYDDAELPKHDWDLKELLDLFCIGTLTDMVPLVEDNRVLVKHGMLALQNTDKPGLKALLSALDLSGRTLSSQDISIKFAPKLNALSRMESDVLPIHIYLEKNSQKAEETVSRILQNNSQRQSLQSDGESKAFEILKTWVHKDFVFVSSTEFHRGIIGLIATKLSSEFQVPAFVGSENSEGMIVGSCRLPSGHDSSLVSALGSAEKFLNRFGGHSAAAGFELHAHQKNEFQNALLNYYKDLKNTPHESVIDFDVIAEVGEINPQLMKWYDHIGPYGVGFNVPIIRLNSLVLEQAKVLKGGHYKLHFSSDGQNGSNTTLEGLLFSPNDQQKQKIQNGQVYDILGELQWNYFRNKQSIQLLVKDLKNVQA